MPVLESQLDTRDEVFQQNKSDMVETLGEIQALLDEAAEGGGEEDLLEVAHETRRSGHRRERKSVGEPLAEGGLAHDHGAIEVLERARDDLAGAGRRAAHQHHHGVVGLGVAG